MRKYTLQDSPTLFDGKVCSTCGYWKPFGDFHPATTYRESRCRVCKVSKNRQRRRQLAEQAKAEAVQPLGRRCSTCNEWKSADQFSADGGARSGLQSRCKQCKHVAYVPNARRVYERKRAWRAAHLDQDNASKRRRYAEIRAHFLQRGKASRERTREHRRATQERYRRLHLDRWRMYAHTRRALKMGNGGSYSITEWHAMCDLFGNVCLCCGSDGPLTVDHVVPLAKGGRNDIAALQPLCRMCNLRKHIQTTDYRDPDRLRLFLATLRDSTGG